MKKQPDSKNKAQKNVAKANSNTWFYVIVAAFTFLLYANSITNGYSLDDNLVTNQNPLIKKGLKALPEIFTTNYVSDHNTKFEYRPLVKATYAIEYQFFKTNPTVSHFVNMLLYMLTGMLLFKFLQRCFNKQNAWLPLLATLLFIAHPVHTEVVNNLKSRDELLALIFALGSGVYMFDYAEGKGVKHLVYATTLFILALMSKASVVCFIGILPMAVFYFRDKKKEAIVSGSVLLVATAVFYILLFALLPSMNREPVFMENPLVAQEDFTIKVASSFYWLSHYIRLMIVPYPLAFYYGYNQLPMVNFNGLAIASMLLHLSLLGYAVYTLFKKPGILGFSAWVYLGGIILFSNILVPVVGIVGERFVYIASLGFCIAVAYGILQLAKVSTQFNAPVKANNTLYVLVLILLVPYSALTMTRNTQWKDALTLFRHDIKVVSKSAKAQTELALELRRTYKKLPYNNPTREKLAREAASHFAEAVKIYPTSENYNYLGGIYLFEEHNPAKAIGPLRKAIELSKNPRTKYLMDLANCYQAVEPRQLDSAAVYYVKVLEKDTLHIQAHYQLAKNAYMQGDTASAKNINRRFLKLHPENPLPYRNQGDFYMIEGDTAKARFWYEKERYYMQRGANTTTNEEDE